MTPTRLGQRWREAMRRSVPRFDAAASEQRLLALAASRPADSSAPGRRRWVWGALAAAVLLAGLVLVLVGLKGPTVEAPRANRGSTPEVIETRDDGGLVFDHDGSRLRVGPHSRVRVVDTGGSEKVVRVDHGRVDVEVRHQEGSSWRFVAGAFEVRVIGTRFELAWDAELRVLRLDVTEGRVELRGPLVEEGKEVTAGERCIADLAEQRLEVRRFLPVASTSASAAVPRERPESPAAAPSGAPSDTIQRAPRMPEYLRLEREGKYAEAVAAALRPGLEFTLSAASADELLTLARAARHAGREDIAHQALMRCRTAHRGSGQAAMAAFLLGRQAPPAEAVQWFQRYLSERPRGAWAREAAGRLIESHQKAGNPSAAHQAARSYLANHPGGPHTAYAKRVLAGD